MKIHILYNFKDGAWGGGNQFLKALRKCFVKKGCYAESPEDADVILFNSHHELKSVLKLKWKYPKKIFVHRVGPIFYYTRGDKRLDEIIFDLNRYIADGTIFQSEWSRKKNYELGMKKSNFETVITNAPDPEIFYPQKNKKLGRGERIKLIATSWSSNVKKGFDIYKFLDETLDFDRYEMTFVGRTPIKFDRIQYVPPQPSERLSEILRNHDIFITASIDEACSNSLIEALHCGLPPVARNDSGHPEIVGEAGTLFEDERDVLDAIEKVAQNYEYYWKRIKMPMMKDIGKKYCEFADRIYHDRLSGEYGPKQVNKTDLIRIKAKVLQWKGVSKIGTGKRLLRMGHLLKMKKLGDLHEG